MPMLRKVGLLALLAGPVAAKPAGCPELAAALEGLTGYRLAAPPAGREDGWCVFDRAVLKAEGGPDLAAERLRLRGDMAAGAPVKLAVEAGGVRVAPGLGQRDLNPVLRETLRFQTAEVAFVVAAGPEGLALQGGVVRLSGGTEVQIDANVAGAELSAASLLVGRLTRLDLDWRNDGKLFRPILEHWGKSQVDGAGGGAAVDAARLALQRVVQNLPEAMFQDEGQDRLRAVLDAVPQGRGRLRLEFRAAEGIGAAQVAVAALSNDPLAPEALARLFARAQVMVTWSPGLVP